MKKNILCFLLILITVSVYAQEIVGNIENYKGETIKINIGGCDQEALKIDPRGNFIFNPVIRYEDQIFTVNMPDGTRVPVMVEKGQKANVSIAAGTNGLMQAKYSGNSKELNTYLFALGNEMSLHRWTKDKTYNSFKTYSKSLDQLDGMLSGLLDKVTGHKELTKQYKTEQKVDVLFYKFNYPRFNKSSEDKDYVDFVRSIDLNNSQLFQGDSRKGSLGYGGLVERIVSWQTAQTVLPNDDPQMAFVRKLKMLNKMVTAQDIKNNVAGYYVLMYFMGGGNKYIKEFANEFYKVSTDQERIDFVKKRLETNDGNTLMTGSQAPDFEMKDPDGKIVKFSDLKGKFVYIDVWATWCGPCVEEIPYVASLHEKYKNDKRVAFVSISIDEDVNKWRAKIDKDKPEWLQFNVEEGIESKMCKEYLISGIPRFMMFDDKGKIINVNARRPSDANFIAFFEEQLNKPKEINLPGGMKMIKLGDKKKSE